jgi:hypothetical protein
MSRMYGKENGEEDQEDAHCVRISHSTFYLAGFMLPLLIGPHRPMIERTSNDFTSCIYQKFPSKCGSCT